MKKYEVQQGFIILSQAKLDGLTTEEKHNVISVARKMKSQATEFEEFIKDTQERVSDKKEAGEIINKEAEKDIEIDIPKLGGVFDKMLEHNSWNVAQTMFVDSKTKCNVLVFKSSRFKEESVNLAS